MTVKELKEYLETIDDENIPVVISGYEGGVDIAEYPTIIDIALDVNTSWYYGKHECIVSDESKSEYKEYKQTKALFI